MRNLFGNRANSHDRGSPQITISPARVLFPLGLGTALSLMGDVTLYTVLPTHTTEAGITLASVGIILSVNRIIRLILNGPAGILYDRLPRRWLFIPALFIGAISTAIYAARSGFWPLMTGRLIWGLAWSGIWVGGAAIILDVTTDQDRGRWTGLYQTWFFLGAAVGAFTGGLLTDRWGYTAAMWIGASVTAVGAMGALIFLPETRSKNVIVAPRSEETDSKRWRPNSEFINVISLQGINRFTIAGILAATLALLVQDRITLDHLALGVASVTGVLIGLRTILSMVAAPMAGSLSDRWGNRWGVAFVGLGLGSLGMLLLVRNHLVYILIGLALTAIAGGSVQALVSARTGDLVDQAQRGKAIGLLHTAGDLGSALGPVTAYLLLRWIGLSGVYILGAGLFAVGAVLALRMYRHYRRTPLTAS
jgi:MFS family permease